MPATLSRHETYLVLSHLRKIGPVKVRRMREALGSVEQILLQPVDKLRRVEGIGEAGADLIRSWEDHVDLTEQKRRWRDLGISTIDCEDPDFPSNLAETYDPPLVLYYQGNLDCVNQRSIGMVGSRRTSAYGERVTKKLGYQIAYAGMTVVSGLARGIDTFAHQAALAAKGKTAAVLGSSIDRLYPTENRVLAEAMVEAGGAILTEFPLGTPPDKQTFPMRNRIVSGLSGGVLVIEAGEGSGSLITARMATEQGRQVFAVPGPIDTPNFKGCHQLIKDGARLVETVEDVLSEYEFLFSSQEMAPKRELPSDLSENERKLLETLGLEEMHIDLLTRKCGLPTSVVSSTLLNLEMRKLVTQLPGKYFIKTY